MPDIYDEEIDRLVGTNGRNVHRAWVTSGRARERDQYSQEAERFRLFACCGSVKNLSCGCPSMIKHKGIDGQPYVAATRALTEQIESLAIINPDAAGFESRWNSAPEHQRREWLGEFAIAQRMTDEVLAKAP